MAKSYVAGIVIRMGAEAKELGSAIDNATSSASKLQKELGYVERAMKIDPGNAELAKQKFDILTESVEATRQKLNDLKQAQKQAADALDRGDISTSEYRALQREITFTEGKLKSLETELNKAGSGWSTFATKAENAEKKLKNFGSSMTNAGSTLNRKVTLPLLAVAGAAVKSAADMEALDSQFEQTFGSEAERASGILADLSDEFDILPNRMKPALIQMTAFAKTTGMETPEALDLASRALRVAADSSAFYDRSLEDTSESLRSFLKGNYENDAALGISATETTRNAKANELYGKSFIELSEAQKQLTLLALVEDGNKASGAIGQAARESDGLVNQLGNMKQGLTDAAAELGENFLPIILDGMGVIQDWVEKFTNLDEGTQDLILKLGLSAMLLGPILSTIGGIAKTLGGAAGGIKKLAGSIAEKGGLLSVLSGHAGLVAVAALAAGVIYLIATNTNEAEDAMRDFHGAIKESNADLEQSKTDAEEMADSARILTGKIDELSRVENKSAIEKAKLKGYVKELNELMPDLNLLYDEEADKLSKSTDNIYDYIKAMKKKLIADANQEHLNSLISAQVDLEKTLADRIDDVAEAQEKYNRGPNLSNATELAGAKARLQEINDQLELNAAAIDEYAVAVGEGMGDAVDSTESGLDNIEYVYDEHLHMMVAVKKEEVEIIEEGNADIETEEERHRRNVEAAIRARLALQEERNKGLQDRDKEFESAKKSHFERLFNIDQEGLNQTGTTMAQATKNLQDQIAAYKNWQENIELLAGKVPPSVISALEELGPEQSLLIEELVNATPEELAAFIRAWTEAGYLASKGAEDELDDLPGDTKLIAGASADAMRSEKQNMYNAGYEVGMAGKRGAKDGAAGSDTIGYNLIQGIKNGLTWQAQSLYTQSANIMRTTLSTMRFIAQEKSPSKATQEIGENLVHGLVNGMVNLSGDAETAAAELSRSALSGFSGLEWMQNPGEFNMPETSLSQKQIYVTGNQFTVREEADVQRIASELDRLVRRQERSLA